MYELKDYKLDIYSCERDGYCREMIRNQTIPREQYGAPKGVNVIREVQPDSTYLICPIRERKTFESYYARGRMILARAILEGRIGYNKSLSDRVYSCLLCGNCKEHCPHDVNTVDVTKALRAEVVRGGYPIPPEIDKLFTTVEASHNIFGEPQDRRFTKIVEEGGKIPSKQGAELVYFPGCVACYRFPEIAASTIKILSKCGVDFNVLGADEWCCGDPLFMAGGLELAREHVEHTVNTIKNTGAKKIVTACAGCYRTFVEEYPEMLGESFADVGIEVVHTAQLLSELLDEGKLKLRKGIKGRVTYHDPCELGRHGEVYDEPRKVIQSIPDVEFVELRRNRGNTWCCGGGGTYKMTHPDDSLDIAGDKLDEAREIKADIILSCCPTCKWNMLEKVKEENAPFKVMDLTEIVEKAL